MSYMTVRANVEKIGNRVGLWEIDERHPDGEVFVAGEGAYQVAPTRLVHDALAQGRLVESEGGTRALNAPSDDEDGEGDVLDGTVGEITDYLASVTDEAELDEIEAREQAGAKRKGVANAIKSRREELAEDQDSEE